MGIYNRDSASCAFTLTSQFDAGVDLVKAGAKLSGSVTVRGHYHPRKPFLQFGSRPHVIAGRWVFVLLLLRHQVGHLLRPPHRTVASSRLDSRLGLTVAPHMTHDTRRVRRREASTCTRELGSTPRATSPQRRLCRRARRPCRPRWRSRAGSRPTLPSTTPPRRPRRSASPSIAVPCPAHIARMKLADTSDPHDTQQRAAVRMMVKARRRCG